jgi:glycopeptide antibiotics resistance protein
MYIIIFFAYLYSCFVLYLLMFKQYLVLKLLWHISKHSTDLVYISLQRAIKGSPPPVELI